MSSWTALCKRLSSLSFKPLQAHRKCLPFARPLSVIPQRNATLAVSDCWHRRSTPTTHEVSRTLIHYFSTQIQPEQKSYTAPQVVRSEDGRQFAAFDMRKHPKLKPSIVRRRLNKMRTYEGAEKNIRHSPWRLNLVCQLAAGLPLQEALTQLEFCKKGKAPLVQEVLKRTSNLASIRHGLQISQLEVAECFATKGVPLKRIRIMGRGRSGKMERKHSHMRVILREIDFKLRIYQAPTVGQKKKWFLLQQEADRDGRRAQAEREELRRLEKQAKEAMKNQT